MTRIDDLEALLGCSIVAKVDAGESLEKYHAIYKDQDVMLRIYDNSYYGNRFLRESIVLRKAQKFNTNQIITPGIIDEWPEFGIMAIEWIEMEPVSPGSFNPHHLLSWIEQLEIKIPFSLKEDIVRHLLHTDSLHIAYKPFFDEHVEDLLDQLDWDEGKKTVVHGDLHLQLMRIPNHITLFFKEK